MRNSYKVSKANLESKLEEQVVIINAAMHDMKELENRVNSSERQNQLLENTNEKRVSTCLTGSTVVRKTLGRLVKSVRTRFIRMATFLSRAMPKRCWREISELQYSTNYTRQKLEESSGTSLRGEHRGWWSEYCRFARFDFACKSDDS